MSRFNFPLFPYLCRPSAGVVKLVDTLDLGSSAVRLGGSSPSTRTTLTFSRARNNRTRLFILKQLINL
jgi:hypothetical protein